MVVETGNTNISGTIITVEIPTENPGYLTTASSIKALRSNCDNG